MKEVFWPWQIKSLFDSVVFLLLCYQAEWSCKSLMSNSLPCRCISGSCLHWEAAVLLNVDSRIFSWDDDMFPVFVISIKHCKTPKISLRLRSMYCWDLGVCKWRDLVLWLTSLAEWEVCHDWFVADGGFLAFWWLPRVKCLKAPLPNIGETFETDLDLPFKADGQTSRAEAR